MMVPPVIELLPLALVAWGLWAMSDIHAHGGILPCFLAFALLLTIVYHLPES